LNSALPSVEIDGGSQLNDVKSGLDVGQFAIVLFSPINICVADLATTRLSGLFVATVTSLLTVRLALWRFHSEKWWERKAELYSRSVEALFDMHSYNRQWLEDFLEDREPSEKPSVAKEERKKHLECLWSRFQKADAEVQKIAVIGAFIVSDAIADDLAQLTKANRTAEEEFQYGDAGEVVRNCLKATENCLARVREHAKEDLGITRKWPPIVKKIVSGI